MDSKDWLTRNGLMYCFIDVLGVISFEGNMTYSEALIETHWDVGLISGTVMPTGFALLGILMIMATFAHQKVRRSGWFEVIS